MLDRLLLLLAFTLLLTAAVPVWRWRLSRKTAALRRNPVLALLRSLDLPARPAILYFTTAACAQCRLRQTPTLQAAAKSWGDAVHIRKLDAVEHEALAQHLGILTVPSTVVLDCELQVQAINHGLANAAQLRSQVAPLLELYRQSICSHDLVPAQA